ncbi:MAG: hypothetical protein BME93_03045 [Methanosarcinales archaeon Met12]|nr:MAG: hypothetical protein BME93_03045 [Methanosarcinales archaeon Met12]
MTRRWISFLFVLLLLFGSVFFSATPALAQETEYRATYTLIDVHGGGSATWTIGHRIALATREEEDAFRKYMEEFEAIEGTYIKEFSNRINRIIRDAEAATGRGMMAKNFDISYEVTDAAIGRFGVIKYQFDWIGFAEVKDGNIVVGDVFVDGFFLSRDDALVIRSPYNYKVDSVTPKPDVTRDDELIWYGLRDFGPGEPNVVLTYMPVAPIWIFGIIAILVVAIALSILKRKKTKRRMTEDEIMKSDEDRVTELLREAGGSMYQSAIVKKTGFSKSKVSAILKSMKDNGTIQKVKKGKENLIRMS